MRCGRLALAAACAALLLLSGCGRERGREIEEIAVSYSAQQMALVASSAFAEAEDAYTEAIWDVAVGDGEKSYRELYLERLRDFFSELTALEGMAAQKSVRLDAGEKRRLEEAAGAFYESSVSGEPAFSSLDRAAVEDLFLRYGLALKLKRVMLTDRSAEVSESEAKVVRLQMISAGSAEQADQIRRRAEEGEDFYLLAKAFSPGRTIDVKAGRGELPKAVEAEAFSMEDGEISGVIRDGENYYVLRMADAYDEAETAVRRQRMQEERLRRLMGDAFRRYMRDKKIALDDGVWAEVAAVSEQDYGGENFFEAVRRAIQDEGIQG